MPIYLFVLTTHLPQTFSFPLFCLLVCFTQGIQHVSCGGLLMMLYLFIMLYPRLIIKYYRFLTTYLPQTLSFPLLGLLVCFTQGIQHVSCGGFGILTRGGQELPCPGTCHVSLLVNQHNLLVKTTADVL